MFHPVLVVRLQKGSEGSGEIYKRDSETTLLVREYIHLPGIIRSEMQLQNQGLQSRLIVTVLIQVT